MQPATMLPKLSETPQTILFSEEDGVNTVEIVSSDVVITTNAGSHNHGSSKVKLKNLVDYNWEPKYYPGQLLAIHLSRKYLAYSIKAPNVANPGTWLGMVRVMYNPEAGVDRRALIRGMKGEVQDLAFAHIKNQVVLACIDEQGHLYVHEIEVTDSGLRCSLLTEILEESGTVSTWHRVVWCPYIPDDEDDSADDDVATLLLTTHANVARMWNIAALCGRGAAGGGAGRGAALAAGSGGAHIVDAAFSPDGTALATACADGYVMFFQVYIPAESSPRCLHKWQPHAGLPLSCLFFLDNHRNYSTDVQFWKFAVTGAENNSVLKVWSCKSWACLQTLRFASTPGANDVRGLKAMVDSSATHLVVSDVRARSLYVLRVSSGAGAAAATQLTQLLLPYPALSFCILSAAEEDEAKCESRCDDPFHRNGSVGDARETPDDFSNVDEALSPTTTPQRRVSLRLYIVQPKGLQEAELTYTVPAVPALVAPPTTILQQQTQQLQSLLLRGQTQPGSLIAQRPESPPLPPQLNLMTPDAFSSPGKRDDDDDPPLSVTPDVPPEPASAPAGPPPASGGSSPSREVQEIMFSSERGDSFYKEEDPEPSPPAEEAVVADGGDAPEFEERYSSPDTAPPPPAPLTHSSSDTSWPQISIAQITEANQRAVSSDKLSNQSSVKSANQSANPSANTSYVERVETDDARVRMLDLKIDKLTELVMQQSRELRTLRTEMASPRDMIEQALHAHAQRTTAAIESALSDGWERVALGGAAAGQRAATAAGAGAARALEPLAAALRHELAAKLTATDHLLRDNIEKLATSKSVMEKLSSSLSAALAAGVRTSLRAAVSDAMLPAMEKAHAQMFRQLNCAFQSGAKEFITNTETAARLAAERGGASAAASLREALDRHAAALAASTAAVSSQHTASALREVAHSVLEKEMAWWREHARSVVAQLSRSHSPATPASPASHCSSRQVQIPHIQALLAAGDYNGAFQLALSASDLSLVVAACRAADPQRVFSPCRLRQHVLLSLVQQLAADMGRDTPLKHRYLEDAIMNLDTSNPVTRGHLPAVIRELQQQLLAFLTAQPGHELARQLKMLLMATEALLKGV